MAKTYYWLKLKDGFFDEKVIKKLRKIAGGDTYTIIYLKMLLKAIKQDNRLYFEGVEESFSEELALDLSEDLENVKITISYLQNKGLLQLVNDDEFFLTDGPQMTGQESESAERVRRHREKKALQCNSDVTEKKRMGNTEIEIEKEIELTVSDNTVRSTDVQRVVDLWNDLPVVSRVTRLVSDSQRCKGLKARIRDYGIDEVLRAVENVRNSPFLLGKSKNGWTITFDWFVRPNNFPKVLDGNYLQNNPGPMDYSDGGGKKWQ